MMISKRARIIELGRLSLTRGQIVNKLVEEGYDNVSYQYVFNTLKERAIVVPKASPDGTSMRSRILQIAATGLTRVEIAKQMKAEGFEKADYHYVFMITKQGGFKYEPAKKKMDKLSDSISETLKIPVTAVKKGKVKAKKKIEA